MTATTLTAGPSAPRRALDRMAQALAKRDFRIWFLGQLTSASGGLAQGVALSWVILQQTGNAVWLTAMTACTFGPTLLLGPWAGAVVDRHDRRRLLLVTQALLLATGLAFSLLSALGTLSLWLMLSLTACSGVVNTVDAPARQVFVVDLVGQGAVASAVGLWEVALNASRVLGPGVAGALLALSGPTLCFLVNALTYLAPLLVLIRLRPASTWSTEDVGQGEGAEATLGGGRRADRTEPALGVAPAVDGTEAALSGGWAGDGAEAAWHAGGTEPASGAGRDADAGAGPAPGRPKVRAREGLAYARHSPLIRALLPMSAASGLIFSMSLSLPTLASRALHFGAGGYGALMAAFGIGGLPGALMAASAAVPTPLRVRRLALATVVAILCTAWAPYQPLAFVGMAAVGLTSIWFIASANTLAQLRSDPAMRGRVMSLWGMAMTGTLPVTGFAVTLIGQHVGAREGFSVSAVALTLAVLLGWRALGERAL